MYVAQKCDLELTFTLLYYYDLRVKFKKKYNSKCTFKFIRLVRAEGWPIIVTVRMIIPKHFSDWPILTCMLLSMSTASWTYTASFFISRRRPGKISMELLESYKNTNKSKLLCTTKLIIIIMYYCIYVVFSYYEIKWKKSLSSHALNMKRRYRFKSFLFSCELVSTCHCNMTSLFK